MLQKGPSITSCAEAYFTIGRDSPPSMRSLHLLTWILLIALCLLSFLSPVTTLQTLYVKPTSNTTCSGDPCLTLNEYADDADQYFNDSTSMIFLAGDHYMNKSIQILSIKELRLVSNSNVSQWPSIVCQEKVGWRVCNVDEVYLANLSFMSCGYHAIDKNETIISCSNLFHNNHSTPAFSIAYIRMFEMVNVSIQDSHSSAIGAFFSNVFVQNTSFVDGGDHRNSSTAMCAVFSNMSISNTLFLRNTGYLGGALFLLDSTATISGKSSFINNSVLDTVFHDGGAIRAIRSYLFFRGNTSFIGNHAEIRGGAILAEISTIYMEGYVLFHQNSALLGGSIHMQYYSHIHLRNTTHLIFQNNEARRGGAIYVSDSTYFLSCTKFYIEQSGSQFSTCFIIAEDNLSDQTKITFDSNIARERGHDIFGGMITECIDHQFEELGLLNVSNLNTQRRMSSVSSEPIRLNFCGNTTLLYRFDSLTLQYLPFISRSTRRGATLSIPIVAVDQSSTPVPATVRAYFAVTDGYTSTMAEGQSAQRIESECTLLNYTVFSELDTVDFYVYADEGPCKATGDSLNTVRIHLLECPLAFNLSGSQCVCENRMQKYTNSCSTDNLTFQRGSTFWLGMEQQNGTYLGLILQPHCPLDYCRSDSADISIEDLDAQCRFNRSGTLCGACRSNLSLALGGSQCLKCTNSHLALLLAFAVAGIVLVFITFLLRLTISIGTLSGLIFYANIAAVNKAIFNPQGTTNVLTIFIAWLNLDVGIVTCFSDGMDTYTFTWLQYTFPLYIWFLALAIVVISQRSFRMSKFLGNNPVSVLTTLFALSYSKILRTIIASLSATTLEYPNNRTRIVWLYDGHVDYLKGKHIPLFIVSIMILLFFFLPYTLFLFFSQWLQVLSNWKILFWMNSARIKIFLDTYHAPYNVKHRYWPGLLLLIRCGLFVIFASNSSGNTSINLLCITAVSLGLAVFTRAMNIYSNRYLDVLEGSFILNLGILAGATYYVRQAGGNQELVIYLSISMAFTEFIGIIIYHVYMQLKGVAMVQHILKPLVNLIKSHIYSRGKNPKKEDTDKVEMRVKDEDDFMKENGNFRESVLYIADA